MVTGMAWCLSRPVLPRAFCCLGTCVAGHVCDHGRGLKSIGEHPRHCSPDMTLRGVFVLRTSRLSQQFSEGGSPARQLFGVGLFSDHVRRHLTLLLVARLRLDTHPHVNTRPNNYNTQARPFLARCHLKSDLSGRPVEREKATSAGRRTSYSAPAATVIQLGFGLVTSD